MLSEFRKELKQEIEDTRSSICDGAVLPREKYLEVMGLLQGLKKSLEILQKISEGAYSEDDEGIDD